MPCLAKKPFSFATIRGAASVRAMKPRVAELVSGLPGAAALAAVAAWAGRPPSRVASVPNCRATPTPAAQDDNKKERRLKVDMQQNAARNRRTWGLLGQQKWFED